MKIKEVRVDVKFTKNLGNYQSFTPMAGVTIQVSEEDNTENVFKEAWGIVETEIGKQLKMFDKKE